MLLHAGSILAAFFLFFQSFIALLPTNISLGLSCSCLWHYKDSSGLYDKSQSLFLILLWVSHQKWPQTPIASLNGLGVSVCGWDFNAMSAKLKSVLFSVLYWTSGNKVTKEQVLYKYSLNELMKGMLKGRWSMAVVLRLFIKNMGRAC